MPDAVTGGRFSGLSMSEAGTAKNEVVGTRGDDYVVHLLSRMTTREND